MKIPKEIYRYIEYELYHYEQYKKDILQEKDAIIDGGIGLSALDGMPKGNFIADATSEKAIRLTDSRYIRAMETSIAAINMTLNMLTPIHRELFRKIYCQGRKDIYLVCDELGVSERTFHRFKGQLVAQVAVELGLMKKMA